jgi:glycosyltransferase involved in cell wall biosynthesis
MNPTAPSPGSVSVVLAVKNGGRYVAEALESVFRSKVKPAEILVIDGNSTDDTAAIASSFPLTRIVPQQSTGIANAYNQAIGLAKGELIAFISHDDVWMPGKLDVQAGYMIANPTCLLSVGMVEHFLEEGATPPASFRRELLDRPHPGWIMEALMARPRVFELAGLFNPQFAVSEDTDWFARVRDIGVESSVLPEVLVRKRVHATNASLNHAKINHLLLRAMRGSVERKKAGR